MKELLHRPALRQFAEELQQLGARTHLRGRDDERRAALRRAEADFLRRYPAYAETGRIDELRRTDYRRLDETGHVYLDYTGGSLYGESQIREQMELLLHNVFGNPHSHNPTSLAMTHLV